MKRALELALLGSGSVSPNPMVGCVIVKDNQVIGEGWHQKYGEAHAEVNAIDSVKNKTDLQGADLYVTLEPCSHHGKTPPCADLIIKYPFKRVIICNTDSNPLVSGEGIIKLKQAGIEVITGVLEEKGKWLNRRFFTQMKKKRPYIILKWAETDDGFIAREDNSSKWISNEYSRKLVHKWRSEEDAIMAGRNTVTCDDPELTVRDWTGKNPVRILIDPQLKINKDSKIYNEASTTLIYNNIQAGIFGKNIFIKLEGEDFLNTIFSDLIKRNIQSVIVEGGTRLLETFIEANAWDEIRRFKSDHTFRTGIPSPEFIGNLIYQEKILNDRLEVFTPGAF